MTTTEHDAAVEALMRFDEDDKVRRRLGFEDLAEDAETRANYLIEYADIISKAMYDGARLSGIWNLERAAEILRKQAELIVALRALATTPPREDSGEVARLRELVQRAQNNVPTFYVNWHHDARAALELQAGGN